MAALSAELRSTFDKEVVRARDTAEAAAQATLNTLAVERDRPFDSMSEEKRALRRALRARARQLGEGDMNSGMPRLIEEIAYEQWHRLLFARFLAENDLLMHPEGVAVTLEECAELAQEEGAEDPWTVATRYASLMLPGIFRLDDPALQVRFAPEGRHKLEQIATDLPRAVFTSDDGLGWAYQFWQSKKKDEVNASERKIGGADISPVTQLFTEDYMVKFLLHNTLGAWWAHRHPDSTLNKTFEYLRYRDDGTPAAGTFDGWPDKAAEVTMMDPCGGSGHFVVAAFDMFCSMRMEEEGLTAAEAGDAAIRDNVHMLELDLRCTQIAAFGLALAAWKHGGYRDLPRLNIACTGIPVKGQLEDWTRLAGDDVALQWTLERLYQLFRQAPDLGSLINPLEIPMEERLFVGEFSRIEVLLEKALGEGFASSDPISHTYRDTARGVAKAARLLSSTYTLVITNVPYLGRAKQSQALKDFCEKMYPESKADLATVFIERCREFTGHRETFAVVSTQYWLFLATYHKLRQKMLKAQHWNLVCRLGSGAFETISGEVVNVALLIVSNNTLLHEGAFFGLDVVDCEGPNEKIQGLIGYDLIEIKQARQLLNPSYKIIIGKLPDGEPLHKFAGIFEGLHTGDYPRFGRKFWEISQVELGWSFQMGGPRETTECAGREHILYWEQGKGELVNFVQERLGSQSISMWIKGHDAWGKRGLAVSTMSSLKATLYTGEVFTHGIVAIVPKKPELLGPIWSFCQSEEFRSSVRLLDQKVSVARATFDSVPFDVQKWRALSSQQTASLKTCNDPRQWEFHGDPARSTDKLLVAVSILLGYKWPKTDDMFVAQLADEDGIVCIPPVGGELPASERLRFILSTTLDTEWSLAKQRELLVAVGFKGRRLENWLRDGFFKHHCSLFQNRPFIWHIWDGRKDGFSALANYHKLDHARLERLIYTYLGDWINTQRAEHEQGVSGADGRLVAALELKKKLELILEGESPYDIYVRWKPLHEQPIGWNPDLNDGVRLNIRPFVTAGVLRNKFTVHWKKDRGKNPDGSERHNDLHFTRAEKEEVRRKAGVL